VTNYRKGDTRPGAELVWVQMMRQAPVWRKLEMVGQMHQTVRTLILGGLRRRYPHTDEKALRRHLADLLLGPDLAARAYGPTNEEQ